MAELQKNNSPVGNAEMAQRFVQFVMMQTQNIYYLLGRIPSPDGRAVPPNLEAAKLFIDQLEMVHEKTRNNLSAQEGQIIEEALAETRGRVSGPSGAAAKLRIPASTLATRIKALRINRSQFKFLGQGIPESPAHPRGRRNSRNSRNSGI